MSGKTGGKVTTGLAFSKTSNSLTSGVLLVYLQKQVGNFRKTGGYPEEK